MVHRNRGNRWKRLIRNVLLWILIFHDPEAVVAQTSVLTKVDDIVRIISTCIRGGNRFRKLALTSTEIADLAKKCKKPGGLEDVGQILGRRNLPDAVLEDTYLRLAVALDKLPTNDAPDMFARLTGTPGFRTTLRKVCSMNVSQSVGHQAEIKLAYAAAKKGHKVISLGEPFSDGIKRGASDIDIQLNIGGRRFACESKNYQGNVPMDVINADAITLLQFKKQNPNSIPVFVFSNSPSEAITTVLRRKGIESIVGDADQVITLLEFLPS